MTVADDLIAKFTVENGGVTLGLGLVEVVVKHLVEVVLVKDVNEIDIKHTMSYASEAWADANDGSALPSLHVKSIEKWLIKGVGSASLGHASAKKDEDDDEDDSVLFGSSGPTSRDLAKLRADKEAQGLSGIRLIRLSVAIELGRAPALGEVVGNVCYGCDPRVTDIVKVQRKAGIMTLSKILDSGDDNMRRELNMHFAGVQREFSELGDVVEASLVTQMWAEAQAVSFDDKVLALYLKEFLRKYPCRGVPMTIDVLIATRVAGSREAGGASKETVAKVREQVTGLKAEVSSAMRLISTLQSEVGRLKSAGGPRAGGGQNTEIVCHKCGEKGHIAKNCPNGKKKKTPSTDDAEEEEKDE